MSTPTAPPSTCTLSLKPFRPTFTQTELTSLKQLLSLTRPLLPLETYASKQQKYGITTEWMKDALEYWEKEFDWSKREERINSVDHYLTTVEDEGTDFEIHFVAHFSSDPNAIPLLLLHGWPGSLTEFISVVSLLRTSTSPSFHIIAPNQPGYGYSSGPPLNKGFGMEDVARISHKLMLGLGFTSGYAAQGGDIGSVLARILATRYEECKAVNLNYLPLNPLPGSADPLAGLTKEEVELGPERATAFATRGRGYAVMHATRPGTIGIVVQSSPVALLAWLAEKLFEWTDEDPSLDEILEIVTSWWILGTFPKSIYAYSELPVGVGGAHRDPSMFLTKPFGFSPFAKEISSAPQAWAKETGNLSWYRFHERGGHFAAMERPEEFAQDMRECFGKIYPRGE